MRFPAFLAAILSLPLPACAQLFGQNPHFIPLDSESDADYTASPGFRHVWNGLVFDGTTEDSPRDLWIESGLLRVGTYWRLPEQIRVAVCTMGHGALPHGSRVLLCAGMDRKHWTAWTAIPEATAPLCDILPFILLSNRGIVSASPESVNPYREFMPEWWGTDPAWSSDEDEYARWLLANHPEFFESHVPAVGYARIRLELPRAVQPVRIESIHLAADWSTSGLQSIPRRQRPDAPPAGISPEPAWFFPDDWSKVAGPAGD